MLCASCTDSAAYRAFLIGSSWQGTHRIKTSPRLPCDTPSMYSSHCSNCRFMYASLLSKYPLYSSPHLSRTNTTLPASSSRNGRGLWNSVCRQGEIQSSNARMSADRAATGALVMIGRLLTLERVRKLQVARRNILGCLHTATHVRLTCVGVARPRHARAQDPIRALARAAVVCLPMSDGKKRCCTSWNRYCCVWRPHRRHGCHLRSLAVSVQAQRATTCRWPLRCPLDNQYWHPNSCSQALFFFGDVTVSRSLLAVGGTVDCLEHSHLRSTSYMRIRACLVEWLSFSCIGGCLRTSLAELRMQSYSDCPRAIEQPVQPIP